MKTIVVWKSIVAHLKKFSIWKKILHIADRNAVSIENYQDLFQWLDKIKDIVHCCKIIINFAPRYEKRGTVYVNNSQESLRTSWVTYAAQWTQQQRKPQTI